MDDRQRQLVAAAEAMRTWVHAQRAMWAEGYPQSLRQAQPQLAAASVAAVSVAAPSLAAVSVAAVALPLPSPVISSFETKPAEAWSDVESGGSWWHGLTERVESTTTFVRTSWKMLAAVTAIVMMAGTVRLVWPGMKQKVSSKLVTGGEAVKGQKQTPPQRGNSNRPGAGAAGAAVAVKTGGRLQVDSNPSGASVLIDGKDRGVTPLMIDGLSVGSHKVMIRGEAGSVQRTVSITAGETAQLSESIYAGWLRVSAPFEVQISEGRRSITLDDSSQVLLPPGPHDLRFENRTFGLREVRHVDIRPGETTAVSLEAPVSRLTVTSSEPATVSIDGQQVGETPLSDFAVRVGTRDVTVTSATGQVRHQMITVKVAPTQINVDFSKP